MIEKSAIKKIFKSGNEWNKSIIIEKTRYNSNQISYYIFKRTEFEYPDRHINISDSYNGISFDSIKEIKVLVDLLKLQIKEG